MNIKVLGVKHKFFNSLNNKTMNKEEIIEGFEAQVRLQHPSWSNADITAKAVRMYYLNEEL